MVWIAPSFTVHQSEKTEETPTRECSNSLGSLPISKLWQEWEVPSFRADKAVADADIYGQASGVSSHHTIGGGRNGGLRGLLGPSFHPNPNPKALQNPEPRPETSML